MKIISAKEISKIYNDDFMHKVMRSLEDDLGRWQEFQKCPRHAFYYPHGVFELMPCCDSQYYTYKYVNCHPANPQQGKSSVIATGMLVDIETGYPQLICDMTVLTAIRTAAMSAIAAKHLAKKDTHILGMIGTGAQSEFQVSALAQIFNIHEVRYYDIDPKAMEKFRTNCMEKFPKLTQCSSAQEVCENADIITTAVNERKHIKLIHYEWIKHRKDLFINAIGGDAPGKTELDPAIAENSRIVLEYYPQTREEGEIQNLPSEPEYTELWELVQGQKPGRRDNDGIILYDSVGFAMADYTVMKLVYEMGLGKEEDILPAMADPKNLFQYI